MAIRLVRSGRGLTGRRPVGAISTHRDRVLFAAVCAASRATSSSSGVSSVSSLPNGECFIVGSEKSVSLPDGTLLDLGPERPWNEAEEIGTPFAADEGNSRLQKGRCP